MPCNSTELELPFGYEPDKISHFLPTKSVLSQQRTQITGGLYERNQNNPAYFLSCFGPSCY